MPNKPELLSPAGDPERLQMAVRYGADAVYLAGKSYGMRAKCGNFNDQELAEAVKFCHENGVKVYVTANVLARTGEIRQMPPFFELCQDIGVDAFILGDLGVFKAAERYAPKVERHISTQMGVVSADTARAWYDLGASRVVLARELSLEEIASIRRETPPQLELEAFVHGAMCMSVSGRCLLSHYLTGRDANRGECTQPCRWKWQLTEEHRPGQAFEVGETEEGSYILNADDLCTAPFIDLILQAGVDSLKIEGRAKTFYYVASTTSAYRRAVNAYLDAPDAYMCPEDVLEELTRTSHRHYSTGFYFGREGATQNTKHGGYIREWEVVGVVDEWREGTAFCTQRGKFLLGEALEALVPSGKVVAFTPEWIQNESGEAICATPHAMMRFSIPCTAALPEGTILRRRANAAEG